MLDQRMKLKALEAYELLEEREIKELNSIGYILEHKKTGANAPVTELFLYCSATLLLECLN